MDYNSDVEKSPLPIKTWVIFFVFAISNVFSLSGFFTNFSLVWWLSLVSVPLLLYTLLKSEETLLSPMFSLFTTLVCILMAMSMLFQWKRDFQLANYVTYLGIIGWVVYFNKLNLQQYKLEGVAIVLMLFGIACSYLFLPNQILGGWNSNSSISSIPIALIGILILWLSDNKKQKVLSIIGLTILCDFVMLLQNRSALLACLLIGFFMLYHRFVYRKNWFRCIYIGGLTVNLLLPLINSVLVKMPGFQKILSISELLSGKEGVGINGRERLWEMALTIANDSPIFGNGGYREIYSHNFSMDVLQEWGWLAYITYIAIVIALMELSFKENSKYNLYLLGFVSLVLMNTFENGLVSNGGFSVLAYMLISLAYCFNWKSDEFNW